MGYVQKNNEYNHETIPGQEQAKQILAQVKETTGTEKNPGNKMIIARSLLPIRSAVFTNLICNKSDTEQKREFVSEASCWLESMY